MAGGINNAQMLMFLFDILNIVKYIPFNLFSYLSLIMTSNHILADPPDLNMCPMCNSAQKSRNTIGVETVRAVRLVKTFPAY